ncbi:uncharacterized protein LOC9646299 [Selaginella moellendorffii]|uniref:uncharacterized protein LOC9646299 n=1 Tax=Selaginella moellendorffii TaxID=88036 RepID=UPI000D1C897C|nr:uncharacterized protein LOC9646299 [Selaginella moellendorffii]|eukprot:XP_024530625.1 uncharacterized protein LOC9646299 [Selaginella moellendorffii]
MSKCCDKMNVDFSMENEPWWRNVVAEMNDIKFPINQEKTSEQMVAVLAGCIGRDKFASKTAFEEALLRGRITENDIAEIHRALNVTDLDMDGERGEYRTQMVYTIKLELSQGQLRKKEQLPYLHPSLVRQRMASFVDSFNYALNTLNLELKASSPELRVSAAIKLAAAVAKEFLEIHPFVDGNGRVSRVMMAGIMFHALGIHFTIPSGLFFGWLLQKSQVRRTPPYEVATFMLDKFYEQVTSGFCQQ